jgi:hypothetical protein
MQLHVLIFYFLACGFWLYSKKSLPKLLSRSFYMFPSSSFIVSGLTFKFLVYFSWLLYIVWDKYPLHSSVCGVSVSSAPHIKRAVLSFLVFLEDRLTIDARICFWVLYSVQLIYMSIFLSTPCSSDFCSFVIHFEFKKYDASCSILLKFTLAVQDLLWFHLNFRTVFLLLERTR